MHRNADVAIIGFGTNDANYYYSINNNITNAGLHYELLKHLCVVLLSSTPVRRIILLPVPLVNLITDSKRNFMVNSMIAQFNLVRSRLADEFGSDLEYLQDLEYGTTHLADDGLHLNHDGVKILAYYVSKSLQMFYNANLVR